jgi:hypothetical protein
VNDLLVLRLALLAIIFTFALVVALTMRGGMSVRTPRPRTSAPGRSPRLVVLEPGTSGYRKGMEFVLAGEMSIGRDPSNSIVLNDASVSADHAILLPGSRGWSIQDLGSTNGTYANGVEVESRPLPLRGNEDIAFGSVVLRFLR